MLTDMFGGTPSNLCLSYLDAGRVDVVTGVNLPILLRLAKPSEGQHLQAMAHAACEHGRLAIRVASDLLRTGHELTGERSEIA